MLRSSEKRRVGEAPTAMTASLSARAQGRPSRQAPGAQPEAVAHPPLVRLVFVDVLRLIATVQMIQGHSIAAVLAPSYRAGRVFAAWTFARGLTSVIFLFSAGFALALAQARAQQPAARMRRARRAGRLVLIGYAMHAPLGLLLGLAMPEGLRAWAAVDVLQCIGVSLLTLELLAWALASSTKRAIVTLALAAVAFGAAPYAQTLAPSGPLSPLADYLTPSAGSLFPLLPWSGYVLVGFALGSSTPARGKAVPGMLAASGVFALTLGLGLSRFVPALSRALAPGHSLMKLGAVLLLAALLSRALRNVKRLPTPCGELASATLFLYVSHVLILYADQVGLAHLLGAVHSPLFGVVLSLVLLVLCSGFVLVLGSLRGRSGSGTRAAQFP